MMSFEFGLRATEILLALAFLQHCAEHIFGTRDAPVLFSVRAGLSVLLLLGIQSPLVLLALSAHSLGVLQRYNGPYNGGSDKMALLVLYCLCLAYWLPGNIGPELAFGYLGVQLILSYFVSGQVKIVNPEWRSGRALRDVFAFSAYPVSEALRGWADKPRLLWAASWAVMVFEVAFPVSLVSFPTLIAGLGAAVVFHVANAMLFGLNRFVWSWIAAFPATLWLQDRLGSGIG